MRLVILILAAVAAAFAQTQEQPIDWSSSGRLLVGSTADHQVKQGSGAYISLDVDRPYSRFALIVRNAAREPIAFCNLRMGRCWDLSITRTGTLRAYDSTSHDGAQLSGVTKLIVAGSGGHDEADGRRFKGEVMLAKPQSVSIIGAQKHDGTSVWEKK